MPWARTAVVVLACATSCARVPTGVAGPTIVACAPASYRYRVDASPGGAELRVEVDVPSGSIARAWASDPALAPFVKDVETAAAPGEVFGAVPGTPGAWMVPVCSGTKGCRVRYRVVLGQAARALDDYDRAMAVGNAVLSPPSAWLLRPPVEARFVLTVTTAPGDAFVSGLARASSASASTCGPGMPDPNALRGELSALADAPYAAFGRLLVRPKSVPGGRVDVAFFPGTPSAAVSSWVDTAIDAVTAYYGTFPIEHAALLVHLGDGSRVSGGRTMGHGGGAVMITVGARAEPSGLAQDWVLVHELVHVSFPEVGAPWAEEGLSTYLEPIIRVRAGLGTEDDLWRSLLEGLPKGQPEEGEGGLDVTDTWGRRYWGGAMFWFLADLEIRERTSNARSLDDALRAVNKAGGNVAVRWDLDRVLAIGDAATGVEVLRPMRRRLGGGAQRVDLDAIWKRLGVASVSGRIRYDDAAPLAAVRSAIVRGDRRATGAQR